MKVCIPRQTTSGFFCQKTRRFLRGRFRFRRFNMFAPEKWWEVGRRSGFLLGWYYFQGRTVKLPEGSFFGLKFDSFSLSTRKDMYQSSNPCKRKLRSMTLWRGTFLAAFKTSVLVHSTVLFALCLRASFLLPVAGGWSTFLRQSCWTPEGKHLVLNSDTCNPPMLYNSYHQRSTETQC